jgi:hypothetical protein
MAMDFVIGSAESAADGEMDDKIKRVGGFSKIGRNSKAK